LRYKVALEAGTDVEVYADIDGQRMATRLHVPYLGSVPLDPSVREGGDAGKPIVVNKTEAVAAQALNQIARQVAARISVINLEE
jgi:ATP-binding protein involved in chromosome partitioning